MKLIHKLSAILMACVLLVLPVSIFANYGPGTIKVQLTNTNQSLALQGVEFRVVQVATFDGTNKVLNGTFAQSKVDLNNIADSAARTEAVEKLLPYAPNEPVQFSATTDAQGTTYFTNLPYGVYLVDAPNYAGFEPIVPLLVEVSESNPSVVVEPKHSSVPVLKINKTDSEKKDKEDKNIKNLPFKFSAYTDSALKNKTTEVDGNTKEGNVDFVLAENQTIYIKETQAPKGYVLSDKVVKVENRNGEILVNDKKATLENRTVTIDYPNKPEKSRQPSPGTNVPTATGTNLWMYVGLLLVAGTGLMIVINKTKKSERDKQNV